MFDWVPRKVLTEIQEAIAAKDRSTHVFYITGAGGAGKTILLRQVGRELGSPDGIVPHFPWSGILDLYHSDVNTNSGLELRLSQALGPRGEFLPYEEKRARYNERRQAGVADLELEEERRRLAEQFATCMNTVTATRRVVIALDTTEHIQYERDEVQRSRQLQDESSNVRPWLLDQLQRWQNCVVLLVGRPEEKGELYLEAALRIKLEENIRIHYHPRTLGGFDEAEAEKYYRLREQDFEALRYIDPDFRRRLWEVTEGQPIRLDLALEAIQRGVGFDKFEKKIEELTREEAGEKARKAAREALDRLLVQSVMTDEQEEALRRVLRYLAAAPKGLDAELLTHLTGWNLDTCGRRLSAVAGRLFVKTRPQDDRLFLHEALYLLCDSHLLKCGEVQELSAKIAEKYKGLIDTCGTGIAPDVERNRQDLQVDSLLYRLRADPWEGYYWFVRMSDLAIRGLEVGFDMRLRREVLGFARSKSPIDQELLRHAGQLRELIDYDCAVHWTRRYIMQGQREQAADLAGYFTQAKRFARNDPRHLAQLELTMLHGEALAYLGRTDEAVGLLRQVIAELEAGRPPKDVAKEDPRAFSGWRRNLVLGRAHNDLGYVYRNYQAHYALALLEFSAAMPYFRASDLLEETANTGDNMGRVYALLNERGRAESQVEDGLALRRRLGRRYRMALSLNSRAILHLIFDQPHRARQVAQEALSICEELGAQRGIVLASITLGQALRQLGAMGLYDDKESDAFLAEAADRLLQAQRVFSEHEIGETVRQIELYNELGCVCREQAVLSSRRGKARETQRLFKYAEYNLTRAIQLAQEKEAWVQYADSCEDLAENYFLQDAFELAETWLDSAEDPIPANHKLTAGRGLAEVPPEERVEECWLQMGKVELLRGRIAYERGRGGQEGPGKVGREALEEAFRHYFFAAAYFQHYSPQATSLDRNYKQLHQRFKFCNIEDLRYLQTQVFVKLSETYKFTPQVITRFFEDTMGRD